MRGGKDDDEEAKMNGFPEYGSRSRFPKKQPKGFCRGCRLPIDTKLEPRAQTWHQACKPKFDPFHVKLAVRKRAGDKCEMCGKDCSRREQLNYNQTKPNAPFYVDCKLPYPFDVIAYNKHPMVESYKEALREWRQHRPKPEYDHIIPHCEGGLFVLENIRLVCASCHRELTNKLLERKASERKLLRVRGRNKLTLATTITILADNETMHM